MQFRNIAFATVFMTTSLTAMAGAKDDAVAHFQAIAAGDVATITKPYADQAVLQWVGGPLDGAYQGSESIHGVWEKFTKANGMLSVDVDSIAESANPKGATVTANVVFKGKNTIKVRYVLTFREGRLVNETWQIDPNLGMSY